MQVWSRVMRLQPSKLVCTKRRAIRDAQMFKLDQHLILTASDLVNHLGCRHLTALDLRRIDEPLPELHEDETLLLLQRKGDAWERQHLAALRAANPGLVEIPTGLPRAQQLTRTRDAMQAGAPIIFQAALAAPGWFGRADFLKRVSAPSALGE